METRFTHLIITAPSQNIAEIYLSQCNSIKLDLVGFCDAEIFAVSDPIGVRVGSGGGTINALSYLESLVGKSALEAAKIAIIHSGGDSRRSPLNTVCGKAWATINAVAGKNVASPMLLLLKELNLFCRHLGPGSVVVGCSDVLLDLAKVRL